MIMSGCQQKPLEPEKVSLDEASRRLGISIPVPTYLPHDHEIREVYIQGNTVTLLISGDEIDGKKAEISLNMDWYSEGQAGGLKLPGEWVTIGKTKGVLVEREKYNDLIWLWPASTSPERPSQFEFRVSAVKDIPKEELIKIAESVCQEG